jgi:hypothetical protein
MAWLRGVSTGAALSVVMALLVGVLIGHLTDSARQQDPVGPRSNENGVPVGYQHSPQGAISAASNYLGFIDNPASLNENKLDAGLRQVAAPRSGEFIAETKTAFNITRQALDKSGASTGGPLIDESKQLGYSLANYNGNRASVLIWGVGLTANARNIAPTASFNKYTLDLLWSNNDWKLASYTNQPGATPRVFGDPTPPGQFVSEAQRYRGFHNAP